MLELGLPAPERADPPGLAGISERFGFETADVAPDDARPAAGAPAGPDSPAESGFEDVAAEPAAAATPPPASAAEPDRPSANEAPAAPPDSSNGHSHQTARADWQDPYAVPDVSPRGRNGSGPGGPDLPVPPWRDPGAPDSERRVMDGNARRRPRGSDPDPASRRPAPPRREAAPRDTGRHDTVQLDARRLTEPRRPDDEPDGAQRPAADRQRASEPAAGPLAREHQALVDRVLTACRAAEGRNVFGSYGNSGLTPAIQRIAAQLPVGGLAPGSEEDTLKPADRFTAKLTKLVARQPDRTPAELAASISDAIRYAFTFPATDYSEGTWLVHRKLKTQGFELEVRRNRWDSSECRGVITRWRDPAHGVAFEVQFHTTESWAVAKQTHDAYVRITDATTPAAERARLRARLAAAAAAVQAPPGWPEITDFRWQAR
jgi:hypothetical protein